MPEYKTRDEVLARIDQGARAMLGISGELALERLDRGDYAGTLVEVELNSLRYLLDAIPKERVDHVGTRSKLPPR